MPLHGGPRLHMPTNQPTGSGKPWPDEGGTAKYHILKARPLKMRCRPVVRDVDRPHADATRVGKPSVCCSRALGGGGGGTKQRHGMRRWQEGGASATTRGTHCALYEEKAILDPLSPMAKGTAVTAVFPYTRLLRSLLSPKTQIRS